MNFQNFESDKFGYNEEINIDDKNTTTYNVCKNTTRYDICKSIDLHYNLEDFIILGCEMEFDGIDDGIYDSRNSMYSLYDGYIIQKSVDFIGVKVKNVDFIDFIDKLYLSCISIVYDNKEEVNMSCFINYDIKLARATGFIYPLIYRHNYDNDPKFDNNPHIVIKISDNFNKNILDYKKFVSILHIKSLYFSDGRCMLIIEIIDIV